LLLLVPLPAGAAEPVSFRKDVWPILKRHCWGCHTGAKARGGLSLDSVPDMVRGGDNGPLFQPGKPAESLLLTYVTGNPPRMPKKQPPLAPAKIDLLRRWVQAGGKDDSTADDGKLVVRIPATYRLAPAVTSVALSPDG